MNSKRLWLACSLACSLLSLVGCFGLGKTYSLDMSAQQIAKKRAEGVVVIGSFQVDERKNWAYGFRGPWVGDHPRIRDTDLYFLQTKGETEPQFFVHVLKPGKYTYDRLGRTTFTGTETVSLQGYSFEIEPGPPTYVGNLRATLERQGRQVDHEASATSSGIVLDTGDAAVEVVDALAEIPEALLAEYHIQRAEIRVSLIHKKGF
jgi:hypothetical protein